MAIAFTPSIGTCRHCTALIIARPQPEPDDRELYAVRPESWAVLDAAGAFTFACPVSGGDHEPMTDAEVWDRLSDFGKTAVGPRRPGSLCRNGYWDKPYRVEAILVGDAAATALWTGSDFALVEIDTDGDTVGLRRIHCTPWDPRRDKVVRHPEHTATSVPVVERFPDVPGHAVLGGVRTPGDDYEIVVYGLLIGQSFWVKDSPTDRSWGSYGPAGRSIGHRSRAAAEQAQVDAYCEALLVHAAEQAEQAAAAQPRRPGDGPPPWVPCICPACAWHRLPDDERGPRPGPCQRYIPAVTS